MSKEKMEGEETAEKEKLCEECNEYNPINQKHCSNCGFEFKDNIDDDDDDNVGLANHEVGGYDEL